MVVDRQYQHSGSQACVSLVIGHTLRVQHGTVCGPCCSSLLPDVSDFSYFTVNITQRACIPLLLGPPIEKRRQGRGTPVFRLMLNLREPKLMTFGMGSAGSSILEII